MRSVSSTAAHYDATKDRLRALDVERVELMLIHRPPSAGAGDIGVSNYSMEDIAALAEATGEVPAVNQIEWSKANARDHLR